VVIPTTDFCDPKAPWTELVRKVRSGDRAAMEDLYQVLSSGVRLRLARQLGGRDINDRVHDLFVLVTESIRNGELRQPERLMGYVRTVERRQVASQIDHELREKFSEMARRILSSLRARDREVLWRFYIAEESGAEICRAMDLTETQYRLIKSRAKTRFVALCRRRMGEKS
jgi:RNA polymerase sigma-70 factor, ECF subfamily